MQHWGKATPKLALACAAGSHIDTIRVELCRAGEEKIKYMEFIMTNCIVSRYEVTGDSEDSFPIETIGINFGKIQWVYTQQKRAGGVAAGNIATGWNLERNSRA
jgi:type VI secretion system secreted protein Hcp